LQCTDTLVAMLMLPADTVSRDLFRFAHSMQPQSTALEAMR